MAINLKNKLYLILGVIALLAVGIGFILGNLSPSLTNKKLPQLPGSEDKKSVYTSQNATIQGKITKVEGNKITVENNQGVSEEIEVLDTLVVNKLDKKAVSGPIASNSAQIGSIEVNKPVMVTLKLKDGVYKAAVINYLPPPPPQSGSSSQSAPLGNSGN